LNLNLVGRHPSTIFHQVEWLDTSAFVSKHFRELLFLLDPVIRAWSSHLPQTTLSLWRSLIAWVGPLSGSRLRLVLAMMQHTMPPKQRVELSALEALQFCQQKTPDFS